MPGTCALCNNYIAITLTNAGLQPRSVKQPLADTHRGISNSMRAALREVGGKSRDNHADFTAYASLIYESLPLFLYLYNAR